MKKGSIITKEKKIRLENSLEILLIFVTMKSLETVLAKTLIDG